VGTLSSELGPIAERLTGCSRVYADANVPAPLVRFMRTRLKWDVLFVVEHDELRRARDGEHFRLARQLRRTLVTLDRDYLDDRRFPPAESGGVVVVWAPNELAYIKLLSQVDQTIFRHRRSRSKRRGSQPTASGDAGELPLAGRKLHLQAGSKVVG
jgi:hypothetical protein